MLTTTRRIMAHPEPQGALSRGVFVGRQHEWRRYKRP